MGAKGPHPIPPVPTKRGQGNDCHRRHAKLFHVSTPPHSFQISGFSAAYITSRAPTIILARTKDSALQVKRQFGFVKRGTIDNYFVLKRALLLCIEIIKLCVQEILSVHKKFCMYKSLLCCSAPKMCPLFNNNVRYIK